MTLELRDGLHEIADVAPRLSVPADLYERGRRVRRRRRATGAAAALIVVAVTAFGVYAPSRSATVAPANSGDTRLPSVVVSPPRFTAELVRAPVEPALVVYAGGESAHTEGFSGDEYPLIVVGPDDAYRDYDRPEWTSFGDWLPTFLLSPDGRYILMTDTTPGPQSASRLLDLATGNVRVLTWGAPIVWSPDGRFAVFMRSDAGGERVAVVSMASDRMVWSGLVTQGVADNTTAAFAADGSLAFLDGSELRIVRHNGQAWTVSADLHDRNLDVLRLAGPAAWTPDGRRIIAMTANGAMTPIAAANGAVSTRPLASLGPQPLDEPATSSSRGAATHRSWSSAITWSC